MPGHSLSELTGLGSLSDTDLLYVASGGESNSITWAQVKAAAVAAVPVVAIDESINGFISCARALGSPLKYSAGPFNNPGVSSNVMVDGTLEVFSVHIPVSSVLTGVMWFQGNAGNYTSDNYNGVGLYSYSAGTLTLVASSTDDGTVWKNTGSTWGQKAFSAPYTAAVGVYFIALLYNSSAQSIAPSTATGSTVSTGAAWRPITSNGGMLYGTLASQSSLPSSPLISSFTTPTTIRWVGLY